MARSHTTDYLQIGRFHVVDVSFTIPPVLIPIFGFRSVSLPEVSVNIRNITEGNYEYPRKVVQGAEVGNVTLEQGSQLFNSDFWDWVRKGIVGRKPPKNLLVVHFTGVSRGFFAGGVEPSSNQITGGLEFVGRVPGKAWLMKECRPVRYKPGSDFDALSQDVSIAQLELAFEEFEEFSLGI